jgi:hypothetical protein
MTTARVRISTVAALLIGLFAGWLMGSIRPAPIHAGAADRFGESILLTGPVITRIDEATKTAVPHDAVYLLDYKAGKLMATVPSVRQTGTTSQVMDAFVERDLVADFKLELGAGPRPHFLMTTGSLGSFNAGWSPLYVFETTTGQVAVYRMHVPYTIGTVTQPKFELLEVRPYGGDVRAKE